MGNAFMCDEIFLSAFFISTTSLIHNSHFTIHNINTTHICTSMIITYKITDLTCFQLFPAFASIQKSIRNGGCMNGYFMCATLIIPTFFSSFSLFLPISS